MLHLTNVIAYWTFIQDIIQINIFHHGVSVNGVKKNVTFLKGSVNEGCIRNNLLEVFFSDIFLFFYAVVELSDNFIFTQMGDGGWDLSYLHEAISTYYF